MTNKIMLCGDIHGDLNHMADLVRWAKRQGVSRLIALGDFGMLFKHRDGFGRLDSLVKYYLDPNDIDLWWLDGNHENFELMAELGWSPDGDPVPTSTERYGDSVKYLPRGATFEWAGKTFMAFGGAISVDKASRTNFISWWADEKITERQVRRVEDAGGKRVDVLLSHDVPEGVPSMEEWLREVPLGYKLDNESRYNRRQLRRVFDAVRPRSVFHGHYHNRYDSSVEGVGFENDVHGLARNGDGRDSYLIITEEES